MTTTQPAKKQPAAPTQAKAETRGGLLALDWQGPLPPPGALAQFNDIIPDGAERIMRMTEREQAHRHRMDLWIEVVGRAVGALLLLLCLAAAVWSITFGADWRATAAFLSIPVLTVVGKFISSMRGR